MVAYLEVFYADQPMGVMSWDNRQGQGWFEFHKAFLPHVRAVMPFWGEGDATNVSSTPLRVEGRWPLFKPAFLTDNLPGPYAVTLLRHALSTTDKRPDDLHPMAWCALQGHRGLGLIGFSPAGYPELDVVEPLDISRLVRYLHALHDGALSASRMRELLRSGLFTTTDRPAALLAINDFNGAVLSGQATIPAGFQAWTCWLDGVTAVGSPSLEACLLANRQATACGLTVLACRPLKDGSLTHLLTRRPDRPDNRPHHLLSFPALMPDNDVLPKDGCEAVFHCLRRLRRPHTEQAAFFRRLVFNGLLYNRLERPYDLHFTCSPEGMWQLAPSEGFPPALQGGMSLNGRYKDWTLDDYKALGVTQQIRRHARIMAEVQSALTALT